eukprot:TRINITY_DN73612_c0_g1_i1.p1 TRINITY_DN73612_c0_g1~~TRINITY_DN73612_c0_g1_i1.p1  ORF type:complete len:510 (+),score=95.82 TRINITY_DN73612_c0_g1_i1:179-1708(+)
MPPSSCGLVGLITDVEGNFEYWCRCVELSRVVRFGADGHLEFSREQDADLFVFGGDVFDKGLGDIRIATALVRFKEAYPDRVFLLAGNRDINKLRFTAELAEDDIDVPQPVPLYPRAPAQLPLRSFLEKAAAASGLDNAEAANTKANRLRWILDHTMTATGAFEFRRQELAFLQSQTSAGENGCSDGNVEVDDDKVVDSFLGSVAREDGFVWRYLAHSQFALLLGNTLFVHGGIPEDAIGWVPTLDMLYRSPSPGNVCGGYCLPENHSLQQWVDTLNEFLREGLRDFRKQMTWRSGEDRVRGGEALLVMTSTPACFERSIMVESMLQAGTPVPVSPRVEAYLASAGVRRVVMGHKPCGDSPFVVRAGRVEFVHCDTTFSDQAAEDGRGGAVAAVEIEGTPERNYLNLRGSLRDGRLYDFALPSIVPEDTPTVVTSSDAIDDEVLAGSGPKAADGLVGRQTAGSGWIKAVLPDGSYHVSFSKPGDRRVSYQTMQRSEVEDGLVSDLLSQL